MACIEREPACASPSSSDEGLSALGSIALWMTIAGLIGTLVGMLAIGALGIGGIILGVMAAALVAAIWFMASMADWGAIKCNGVYGTDECAAGVVVHIEPAFSRSIDGAFPFMAIHDRVDLLVTSAFWDLVEEGATTVLCTDEDYPRRSELLQCYYYTPAICSAMTGTYIGVGVGAVVGTALGIAAAVAIAAGCTNPFTCLLGLLVALIIAIVAVVLGAMAGGNIGRAVGDEGGPTGETEEEETISLSVGDLITVSGNLVNVGPKIFWWVEETTYHDRASDDLPQPYSYCEIDEELPAGTEGCIGPD
jgi:hypothetical protein